MCCETGCKRGLIIRLPKRRPTLHMIGILHLVKLQLIWQSFFSVATYSSCFHLVEPESSVYFLSSDFFTDVVFVQGAEKISGLCNEQRKFVDQTHFAGPVRFLQMGVPFSHTSQHL